MAALKSETTVYDPQDSMVKSNTVPVTKGAVQGIDVSHHQGAIDWEKVKNDGIEFAIIRAGWGTNGKDKQFESNYLGCKRMGIPVGVYLYSYASNAKTALEEAKHFESLLKGKEFDLPVFLDIEEKDAFASGHSNEIVDTFCSYLESKGFYVGVYCSKSYLNSHLTNVTSRWAGWVAQWADKCTYSQPYLLWQYSSKGRVAGINGYVDLDQFASDGAFQTVQNVIHERGYNGIPKLVQEPEIPKKHIVVTIDDAIVVDSYF